MAVRVIFESSSSDAHRRRYSSIKDLDWLTWQDGAWWELTQGVDFEEEPRIFRQRVYHYTRTYTYKQVDTHLRGNDKLLIRFRDVSSPDGENH